MNDRDRDGDASGTRGSTGVDPYHDAVQQARHGWRTTGMMLVVVGLAVAAASLLGIVRRGSGAHTQDFLSLGVGGIFVLLGAWLAVVRSRRAIAAGYRSGASAVLLSAVVIAGGLALIWAIVSRLF